MRATWNKWQYNTNNTRHNSVAACLGGNYNSNKEVVRSSSSKFCFNIDELERKWVSTINIRCFGILQSFLPLTKPNNNISFCSWPNHYCTVSNNLIFIFIGRWPLNYAVKMCVYTCNIFFIFWIKKLTPFWFCLIPSSTQKQRSLWVHNSFNAVKAEICIFLIYSGNQLEV